ncbi:phage holin family protein [Rhizobium lemnae]|uniref:Phage holin family protein n=1 Tax=Rhizobium lemnae TaxID=1214924 RepID=A0ABV8E631_9HYPH|nr:phage holin family protein [Rhizobium lemnae]MCJ8507729.1 phage holin family protein [Rhizobium lemnae]
MSNPVENRPLSELLTGLVGDVSGLFRKEINLAKAEASEKVSKAMTGVEMMAAGLVFAIGAIGVLLAAAVSGLSALLLSMGFAERNADAIAAVVVGLVVAVIGWGMISRGLAVLKGSSMNLDRTTHSLQRDVQVLKERT